MSIGRVRGVFGVDLKKVVPTVGRAEAMYEGMFGDPGTYANPPLALPAFKTLITNVNSAQTSVKTRVIGARATRDVELQALVGGMEIERLFMQGLADANPAKAVKIIENGGLVVAGSPVHSKLLLVLRKGPHPGTVACTANVALLIAEAAPKHPHANKWFGWQYTVDGGKTLVTAPNTGTGKTLLTGLPALVEIEVRVNITIDGVTTKWSDPATIVLLQ